ncbi:hypothetical protein OESDEN_04246 [Oesophagostomum dentatum]|uniref:Uncharacterized protein n=1 Tax=Oesophagostomum dentatum TaxID=61180 RepID=A0A0B1TI78_OESDE|nr:hypothetical protein OESDEN_04246 [Oesophagostomum dentatum]
MKESREKKKPPATPGSSHMRTISPDVAMPATLPAPGLSPHPEGDIREDNTQDSSEMSKSIHWSALANPSMVNAVNQETIVVPTQNPPRLLNDLKDLLSPSKAETDPSLASLQRSNSSMPSLESTQRSDSSMFAAEGPSTASPKKR